MADNVWPLAYWALGQHRATGEWPEPGTGLVTGGSPRYRVYRTAGMWRPRRWRSGSAS